MKIVESKVEVFCIPFLKNSVFLSAKIGPLEGTSGTLAGFN